jgi:hypothetical protein
MYGYAASRERRQRRTVETFLNGSAGRSSCGPDYVWVASAVDYVPIRPIQGVAAFWQ